MPFENRRKRLSLCLGRRRNMQANKPPTEEISRNEASARCLRIIYLPVKYGENSKSPILVLARAAENPKKGGNARSPDCKYMYSLEIRCARAIFPVMPRGV